MQSTPGWIARRLEQFENAGADLVLLQFSPQAVEMERFASEVIPRLAGHPRHAMA